MVDISSYDAIGFDVDHTLCRYKLDKQIQVGYDGMVDFLVTVKGYPNDLWKPIVEHGDFCYRGGLLYDVQKANFLKLAKDGRILKATHGLKVLDDEDIAASYENSIWQHMHKLHDGMLSEPGVYHFYENNFDILGIVLVSRMVEYTNKTPKVIWNDLVESVEYAWHPIAFKDHRGGYFPAIKTDPEKYLKKTSTETINWIKSLKEMNKFVFLVSSAHCDCVCHVMDFCIGDKWQSMFDIIITKAGKPRFFTGNAPFLGVDQDKWDETEHTHHLNHKEWFSQGNCKQLTETIERILNVKNPKVLYFGDSLRSDIVPPNISAKGWDAIYVMEELLDHKIHNNPDVDKIMFSNIWGNIISDTAKDESFYEHLIRKYAKIAISSLDEVSGKLIMSLNGKISPMTGTIQAVTRTGTPFRFILSTAN